MPFLSLRVFEVHKINEIVIKLKKKKKENHCKFMQRSTYREVYGIAICHREES